MPRWGSKGARRDPFQACFTYDSDFYHEGKCNQATVETSGCGGNSIRLDSKGARVDDDFTSDTGSGKWTVGAFLMYGMAPNKHIYHSYESFVPSLQLYQSKKDAFKQYAIPSDFYSASHANTTIAGFGMNHGIKLLIVDPSRQTCVDNFVLVTGIGILGVGPFGPFLKEQWMSACGLSERSSYTDNSVLFYRRSPELYGNIRYITNWIDVEHSMIKKGINTHYWKMERSYEFCSQVRLAHTTPARVVVTPHGTHMIPLVMLPAGSTIIEILPRTLSAAMFCNIMQSVDVKIVSFAESGTGFYKAEHWCDTPGFFKYEASGAALNHQLHQELLSETIFLDSVEIQALVAVVDNLKKI